MEVFYLHYLFVNPPLPYHYNALEPYIDAKTMELHHNKHLQTYIDNLNAALKDYPEYQQLSLEQLLLYSDFLPDAIKTTVKNNAGGVLNHIYYFSTLKNPTKQQPENPLAAKIQSDFGSFSKFQDQFTKAALSLFGSGYVWLVESPNGQLKIITTPNQDTPLEYHLCPILNLDMWEHAYYLKNYNNRLDYINHWFHVINWEQANKNLSKCET